MPESARPYLNAEYSEYRHVTVKVSPDSEQIEAWTYMFFKPEEGLKPSKELLQTMVAGATAYGFSEDYIERLRTTTVLSSPAAVQPEPVA